MNSYNWCIGKTLGIRTYKVEGKEMPKIGCFRRLQHSSSQTSTTESQGWRMSDDTWMADSIQIATMTMVRTTGFPKTIC